MSVKHLNMKSPNITRVYRSQDEQYITISIKKHEQVGPGRIILEASSAILGISGARICSSLFME